MTRAETWFCKACRCAETHSVMGNAIVRTAAIQITKRHNHRKCDHKDIYFDLVFIIYLIKNADLSCLMEVASFIASHTVCFVQFHEQNFDQFKFSKK